MNKYLISKEPFVMGCFTEIVEKENTEEILKHVFAKDLYPLDEEDEENLSKEELIEKLEEINGDGCAYLISIVNLTTGEVVWRDTSEV